MILSEIDPNAFNFYYYVRSFHIIEALLLIELLMIAGLILFNLGTQGVRAMQHWQYKKAMHHLNTTFLTWIQDELDFDKTALKPKYCNLRYVVQSIQRIDENIHSEHWLQIKLEICDLVIKDQIQSYIRSKNWMRRSWGVQALSICTAPEHEQFVLSLLKDPIPLIRFASIPCAMKVGTPTCILAIIEAMSRERPLARYPYLDPLLHGPIMTFDLLKERLQNEKNPAVRISILQVLSQKLGLVNFEAIKDDLQSENIALRWWALRTLANMPSEKASNSLIQALESGKPTLQSIASKALGNLRAKESLEALRKLLNSSEWFVRASAAISMRLIDPESITPSDGPIAEYALALPVPIPLGLDDEPMHMEKD